MKRFIKCTILATIVLLIAVSTAGCTSNVFNNASPQPTQDPNFVPKNTAGYLTYSNHGFTIQYPPSWQVSENKREINETPRTTAYMTTFAPGPTGSFVQVESQTNQHRTLDDFSKTMLSLSQTYQNKTTDLKLNESSKITLAGYPAQKYGYTYTINGVTWRNSETHILVNETGYSMFYSSPPETYLDYLPIVQNMTQSFNIVS
jgi:hypothetical protein